MIWARYLALLHGQFVDLAKKIKLDESGKDQIRISARKLAALNQLVGESGNTDLRNWAASLHFLDINDLFARFAAYISTLQNEFKTRQFVLKTSNQSVEIPRPQLRLIDTILVHLLRNAAVHGIEPMDERRVLGKDPIGTIAVNVQHIDAPGSQIVTVEVNDDGRGIQVDKFRQFAVTRGHWSAEQANAASEEEVLKLIFLQDFTSAAESDVHAGRGVGLDAVREAIDALGAKLSIRSTVKIGTTFTIEFTMSAEGILQPA